MVYLIMPKFHLFKKTPPILRHVVAGYIHNCNLRSCVRRSHLEKYLAPRWARSPSSPSGPSGRSGGGTAQSRNSGRWSWYPRENKEGPWRKRPSWKVSENKRSKSLTVQRILLQPRPFWTPDWGREILAVLTHGNW